MLPAKLESLEIDELSFRTRVERLIDNALSDGVSLARIADELNLSQSAVRRRLKREADVSFQALVENRRKAIALRLLEDGGASVAQVAFVVGYSDPSNFVRAFKRWTGSSPSAYLGAS